MIKINGAANVAKQSKHGTDIYFDFDTCTVNTKGKGHHVTKLIRKCTASEVKECVQRWMAM